VIPLRCSNCNKLLGMIDGRAEIKCPKCKTMNEYPKPIKDLAGYGMVLYEDGWVYHNKDRIGWVRPEERDSESPRLWTHVNS